MAGAMEVRLLGIGTIDEAALGRDREGLDAAAMEELKASILRGGVRMPIEVFALAAPEGEKVWGLLTGFRRLYALRAVHAATEMARFAAIPGIVRPRMGEAAAMAAMVTENEVRAGVSAWERGRIAVAARDAGAFATVEAAVEGLYGSAGPVKRGRLRALARLAEALEGALPAPERLSERQALAVARAVQAGHGAVIRAALAGVAAGGQWRALAGVLGDIAAAEALAEAEPGGGRVRPRRRGTERRRQAARLRGRRERLAGGWALTVTGPDASEAFAAAVMARIRELFGPG